MLVNRRWNSMSKKVLLICCIFIFSSQCFWACIWLQTQHKKAAGYFHSSTCDQKSCSLQTIILHDALQRTQHTNRFSLTTQKCRQSLITCLFSSNLLPELALNHAPMPRRNFLDRVKMYFCFEIGLLLGLVVCCWAN